MIRVYDGRNLLEISEDAVSTTVTVTGALLLLDDHEQRCNLFPDGAWTRCVVEPD